MKAVRANDYITKLNKLFNGHKGDIEFMSDIPTFEKYVEVALSAEKVFGEGLMIIHGDYYIDIDGGTDIKKATRELLEMARSIRALKLKGVC